VIDRLQAEYSNSRWGSGRAEATGGGRAAYPDKPLLVAFAGDRAPMGAASEYLEPRGVPTFPLIEDPFEVLDIMYRCRVAQG